MLDSSPIVVLFAKEGMPGGCPALYCRRSTDRAGRSLALRGALLCGVCLGATTMSLHHKLCHVLGGSFDLPHARTYAVILPYVAAFNLPAAPSAASRCAERGEPTTRPAC
jgi:maleylacetate reductase